MSITIKLRKGLSSEWTSNSSIVLASGEPGFELDTGRLKIGNGVSPWSNLNYISIIPTGLLPGNGININLGSNGATATISHADTSSQSSIDNSNGSVIQDISVDTYGHITSIGSTNLDDRYYTETESDSRFINTSGDTMTGFLVLHADPSNSLHPATKQYVDNAIVNGISVNDAMVFKGAIDCSANPNYPSADRGWTYKVSVAGKIGGVSGLSVEVNDTLICTTDGTAAGTHASVGSNWVILQTNIVDSDILVRGPASSTDNRIALFDGASGKLIKQSSLLVSEVVTTSGNQTINGEKTFRDQIIAGRASGALGSSLTIQVPNNYSSVQYQDTNIFKIENYESVSTVFSVNGLGEITQGSIGASQVTGFNSAVCDALSAAGCVIDGGGVV